MKALTLHQPWASLVADGIKTIETRSWATKHRGRLAIHAGSRWGMEHDDAEHRWHGFSDSLCGLCLLGNEIGHDLAADEVPLGAIVSTAQLVDCVPINPQVGHEHEVYDPPDDHIYTTIDGKGLFRQQVIGDPSAGSNVISTDLTEQLPLGDYRPGRWAWLLDDIKPTTERCPDCAVMRRVAYASCWTCHGVGRCDPIPARGRQGLWTWTPEAVSR